MTDEPIHGRLPDGTLCRLESVTQEPTALLYKGRRLDTLSRKELIEAVTLAVRERDRERAFASKVAGIFRR